MGNILSYIRSKFGSGVSKVTIEDEKGNVVTEKELKKRHEEALKDTIQKSIELIESETSIFDNATLELGLKIKACEEVLTKGENSDVAFNKTKFLEKRETIVKGFIQKILELKKAIDEAEEELNKAWEEKVVDKILKASEHQKEKVKKTMDEFASGSLNSGSGDKVTDRKQAIAIALSQAGLSKKKKTKKAMDTSNTPGKETPEDENGKASTIDKLAKSNVTLPKKDFVEEHKNLVNVLETGSEEERKTEASKQKKELQSELKKAEGDDNSGNYVAIICTDEKNRVLLMKRKDGQGWMLPGGHIEAGETTIEATKREFKEETNLDVRIEDFFEIGDEKLPDGKNICFYRTYKNLVNGQLANIDQEDEAIDIQSFCAEEWLKLDMFKDTKEYLKKFLLPGYLKKGDFTSKEYQEQLQKSLAIVKEAIGEGILEKDFIEK